MAFFYDTNILLDLQEEIFKEFFYISNISLIELENIKSSKTKDEDIKWKARNILRLLSDYKDRLIPRYEIVPYNDNKDFFIKRKKLAINNDSRIIATAYKLSKKVKDLYFVTQDLSCAFNAESVGLKVNKTGSIKQKTNYNGYKSRIFLDDDSLAEFYNNDLINNFNRYNLIENQYLLIADKD